MPFFEYSEEKFRLISTKHFFVTPADHNYIQARFCRIVGLHKEFSWQCLQALEKYFKAGLILNGVPAKRFSHDLPRLLLKHRETYGEFAVQDPVRPDNLNADLWKTRTLDDLVEWIHYFGHPDSRYGLRSYVNDPSDLFLLDEFVFELRRRIGRLTCVIGNDIYVDGEPPDDVLEQCRGMPFSFLLKRHSKFQFFRLNIPEVEFSDAGETLEDALYNWNFPFSRSSEDLKRPPPKTVNVKFGGFGNSLLYLLQESVSKPDPTEERKEAIRTRMEWLFNHVQVGRDFETNIQAILAAWGTRA